jgi:phage-related minor tail protein
MEIFRLLGTIAIDAQQANQAITDTTEQADDAQQKVSDAFTKIGGAALKIGTAFVAAGAVLGGAFVAAIESTREYRTQIGMLETAFQTAGHSTEAAKQTFSDLNAVLGDSAQATEAAQHLALLTDSEKELQTWTDICTGVYATFGEALPIESLTEASNETAKTGILTGGLVDALNWAGESEEEFQAKLDACTTEQQRQDLIMNTLNGTYSKASEQYKETNKDVLAANRAQERLTNAMAQLGAVGEPILTAIKDKVAEFVAAAVPHLENMIAKMKDVATWVKNNQDTIDAWAAVIIGATVSIGTFLLVLKWGAIMTAAANAIKVVRTAFVLLNTTMLANPILLVVSLIAGLVAAFVYLWQNNEGFRKFWIDLWDKIKSACGTAVGWIKGKFGDLKAVLKTVQDTFGSIKDAIAEKLDAAREKVESVIEKIKGFFPFKLGKLFDNIKIPKISVSGGKAPFGIAGKGKLPSFSVKWNAQGGILTKPTIFGMAGNTLLGGGEAGDEAVAPIDLLQEYIRAAVQAKDNAIVEALVEQNRMLMTFLQKKMPQVVRLDSGALVGELIPAIDVSLSDRWNNTRRGNTR